MSGAPEMLENLRSNGWRFTVATGGWETSAVLKLRAAGIPTEILGASSTDSPDRCEVFRLAASRVGLPNGKAQSTVLVGDGLWDVRVAAQLGFRFVGINSGPRADQLRQAGAQTVVPDFADVGTFLQALDDARVPATLTYQQRPSPIRKNPSVHRATFQLQMVGILCYRGSTRDLHFLWSCWRWCSRDQGWESSTHPTAVPS